LCANKNIFYFESSKHRIILITLVFVSIEASAILCLQKQ